MSILEYRRWGPNSVKHYVTGRTPVFCELPIGVHSVNVGVLDKNTYVKRKLCQYMLIYTSGGEGIVEFDGESYVMEKNKVCIFKPGDLITYYPTENWECKWIFIEGDTCKELHGFCYKKGFSLTEINNTESSYAF